MPKVRIQCNTRISFDQVVEMTQEDYEAYQHAIDKREHDSWFSQLAESYVDTRDVLDWEDFDDVVVELVGAPEHAAV